MQQVISAGRFILTGALAISSLCATSVALAEAPAEGSANADASARDVEASAPAQNSQAGAPRLGGHIGTATPLVTVSKNSRTIADAFTLLHPIGISLKFEKVTVDFETVVVNPIDPGGRTGLVIDPGVIYNFGPVAAGLRFAWQQADSNFGLIPLVNKGILDIGQATWFVEAAFPTFYADSGLEFNTVLHSGVGF
jgi:hypothetical protein